MLENKLKNSKLCVGTFEIEFFRCILGGCLFVYIREHIINILSIEVTGLICKGSAQDHPGGAIRAPSSARIS